MNKKEGIARRTWIRVGTTAQIIVLLTILVLAVCVKAHGVPSARSVHQQLSLHTAIGTAKAAPVVASVADRAGSVAGAPVSPVPTQDAWSSGDIVASLSSFYQTIITVLISLLGLLGVVSVITLRFLSNATAEETAHKAAASAMQHALDTKKFYDKIDEAVEESGIRVQLEDLASQLDDIQRKSDISPSIKALTERVAQIEEELGQLRATANGVQPVAGSIQAGDRGAGPGQEARIEGDDRDENATGEFVVQPKEP